MAEDEREEGGATQWGRRDGGYMPVGDTVGAIPPGTYDLVSTMFGSRLVPKEVTTDEIASVGGPSGRVVQDIARFWSLRDRYKKFGFVHKCGFLLHGPPGTGKTTTLTLVARDLVAAGGVVLFVTRGIDHCATMLADIRTIEPDRQVAVVLEDVDSLINVYEEELLALMDGKDTVEGVVFLATTNDLDAVPDRFKRRPSRFDRLVEIGGLTDEQRRAFFDRKLPGQPDREVRKWVAASAGMTAAQLKDLVIRVAILEQPLDGAADEIRAAGLDPDPEPDDVEYDEVSPG